MWLLNLRAAISAASRTGPALPSPITASRFLMLDPCSAGYRPSAAPTFSPMIQIYTPGCDSPLAQRRLDALAYPDYTPALFLARTVIGGTVGHGPFSRPPPALPPPPPPLLPTPSLS